MISAADILCRAPGVLGVELDLLLGRRRFARLSRPRQVIALALRRAGYSTLEIGELMHRDHSTICYQLDEAERRETGDPTFAADVRALLGDAPRPPPMKAPIAPDDLAWRRYWNGQHARRWPDWPTPATA
jgi:hypothetical protein